MDVLNKILNTDVGAQHEPVVQSAAQAGSVVQEAVNNAVAGAQNNGASQPNQEPVVDAEQEQDNAAQVAAQPEQVPVPNKFVKGISKLPSVEMTLDAGSRVRSHIMESNRFFLKRPLTTMEKCCRVIVQMFAPILQVFRKPIQGVDNLLLFGLSFVLRMYGKMLAIPEVLLNKAVIFVETLKAGVLGLAKMLGYIENRIAEQEVALEQEPEDEIGGIQQRQENVTFIIRVKKIYAEMWHVMEYINSNIKTVPFVSKTIQKTDHYLCLGLDSITRSLRYVLQKEKIILDDKVAPKMDVSLNYIRSLDGKFNTYKQRIVSVHEEVQGEAPAAIEQGNGRDDSSGKEAPKSNRSSISEHSVSEASTSTQTTHVGSSGGNRL
ncbi:uncharacterized protein [Periplaneta americana]|uniref:uncharacterized protein n=1 Tax=Periplaneta americana TaxID=6978 RepID=UPI0037E76EBC